MENEVLNTKIEKDFFLDNTLSNIDLNKDMAKIYELLDNDELNRDYDEQKKLSKLRNENYKRYKNINILKYKNLPKEFSNVIQDIDSYYNLINVKNILNDNYEDSHNNKVILDAIYVRISRIDNMVKSYLKQLTNNNNERQKKFNITYLKNLNIDEKLKKELIEKYNDLVVKSANYYEDIYEELDSQNDRKASLDEMYRMLNIELNNKEKLVTEGRVKSLNIIINIEIEKYKDKLRYLDDLIIKGSKYTKEFNEFKVFFNKLIAYDDTDYDNARQTFEILCTSNDLKDKFKTFEELFVSERESVKKEEKFVFEKVGVKNLVSSLNYIITNYNDTLTDEDTDIIKYIYDRLNSDSYDLYELNRALKLIVRNIWHSQITDIYSFNPKEDFYFICSNNQFIDEKYETVLITKKELEKSKFFDEYQIGFVCGYNDNILYMTENDDIMSVDNDDMSNLKTPLQIEQEFLNFNVLNKIALNGFVTKIVAVYFINDGDRNKYFHALELANQYNLPLLELRR